MPVVMLTFFQQLIRGLGCISGNWYGLPFEDFSELLAAPYHLQEHSCQKVATRKQSGNFMMAFYKANKLMIAILHWQHTTVY